MITRRTLLKRGAGAGLALTVLGKIPTAPVAEAATVTSVAGESIIAAGGLCVPLSYYYDLPVFSVGMRCRRFESQRGGITFREA